MRRILIVFITSLCPIFLTVQSLAQSTKPILQVGTEGLYPPYDFCGTPENSVPCASPSDLKGFDIDIAMAVCDQIGYECSFVLNDWTTIFKNLKSGSYDAIFSAVGYRADRTKYGNYTITYEDVNAQAGVYFYTTTTLLPSLTFTPVGMAGKTISVQTGTLHEAYLQKNFTQSNILKFATQSEANLALVNGTSVAVLTNADVMAQFLVSHPQVINANSIPISYDENGFNVDNIYALVTKTPKDLLLYDKINNALLKLQLSGYVTERHKFWIPATNLKAK
jgi:ABC-type amino acid transport substrate-binding protein